MSGLRRARRALTAGVALGVLTGCTGGPGLPHAHEIQRTVVMQTLGVDLGREKAVAVTASSESRPGVGDSPGEEPVVLTAQADTITAACAEMETFGREDVFYGDVEQVLIGEGLARQGLGDLLEHMALDQDLRLEAQVWVVRGGSAADALFAAQAGGGAAGRLHALENDGRLYARTEARSARRALVDLLGNGCTFLPAVTLAPAQPGDGAQGERELVRAGYALFRDGALCAWADEEAARGLELLLGRGKGEVLELPDPEGVPAALELTEVKTSLRPSMRGGVLTGLTVWCRVEARAEELRGAEALDEDRRNWLTRELDREIRQRLAAATALCQGVKADAADLGLRAALVAPWAKEALTTRWDETFPELELTLTVEAKVARR